MKAVILAIAVSALAAGSVTAQQRDDQRRDQRSDHSVSQSAHPGWGQNYGGSHQWKNGDRIGYDDWSQAAPVSYRSHHLRQPPRGYEWRESNGQYVMAAVATGVIASIVLNNHH